ncbi:MAG: hypothetical protein J7M03_07590, partial [Candidatus Desulfofervidaceae bacterium]|nr:hypothetical protein [Candidatus Desulfofervidaceae bacterium]
DKWYNNIWSFLKEARAKYVAGELNSSKYLQEENYFFSIFFFPQRILQKIARKELVNKLKLDFVDDGKLTICL